MTDLEKNILAAARPLMTDELVADLSSAFPQSATISVPFECHGVINSLVFDVGCQRFTHIIYPVAIGACVKIGRMAGSFGEFKMVKFAIED